MATGLSLIRYWAAYGGWDETTIIESGKVLAGLAMDVWPKPKAVDGLYPALQTK